MAIQLPEELQNTPSAQAPALSSALAPSPALDTLAAGAPVEQPTNIAPGYAAPGSFSAKLHAALFDPNAKIQLGPDGAPAPGAIMSHLVLAGSKALAAPSQWESALSGKDLSQPTTAPAAPPSRGQQAISGITGILADAAAAGQGPGGVIAGITATAGARGERLARETKDRQALATANAQMIHEQTLTHALGEEQIAQSVKTGQMAVDTIKNAPAPGTEAYTGQTSDQLHQLLADKKIDPTKQSVYPTGRIQTGEDKNGMPMFRTTYTVMNAGGPVDLNKAQAAYLNKNSGQATKDNPEPFKEGQSLSNAQFNLIQQQAANRESVEATRKSAALEAGIKESELKAKSDAYGYSQDQDVLNAISRGGGGLAGTVKAYDALKSNPDFMAKHPGFEFSYPIYAGFGDAKNFKSMQEEYGKQQEKKDAATSDVIATVGKNPITALDSDQKTSAVLAATKSELAKPDLDPTRKAELLRVQAMAQDAQHFSSTQAGARALSEAEQKEAAKKRAEGPQSDKVGAEYIATLPPGRAASLKAIYDGSIAINPAALERTDKGQAFMSDIYQAYPDFQAYKGETWPKAHNEYMGSGPTAKAKINYNTALQHLQDVYDNSGAEGFIPGTEMYRRRQAALPLVINEVGKAVKTGVVTEGEYEEIKNGMSGWTPASRRERVVEVGKLLHQKIQEFQQAFQDAAPSAQIKVPTLISPAAQASWDYMQRGGRPAAEPTPPVGATHTYRDAQGNIKGWAVNNKFVPVGAQ